MLSKQKIARINELAKKGRENSLTTEEAKEQSTLRREYLETFRKSMSDTLEHVKVIDPEGNDVTPEKIKQIKERRNLH
ncbi:DUF896 domain-containing protein [Peribacillus sp. SCS-26]|uniref:DUF896 domain-containing protein n=1 Tax=Paraperibacillus marinus TaxID=3115295 RepID=UPI003905D61E